MGGGRVARETSCTTFGVGGTRPKLEGQGQCLVPPGGREGGSLDATGGVVCSLQKDFQVCYVIIYSSSPIGNGK